MRSSLFDKANAEAAATGRYTLQNPAMMKVTLTESAPLIASQGAMSGYQGAMKFSHEGAGAKRFLKGAIAGESMAMMRCTGNGELFIANGGHKLHLIELDAGEAISASSSRIVAFDQTVSWDVRRIAAGIGAMVAGGLFDVLLTGPGTVVISADWPVVLNTSEAPTLVDPNALVAYQAGLKTEVRRSFSAKALIGRGSGEAIQLEFSAGGFVIIEPEPQLISTGTK